MLLCESKYICESRLQVLKQGLRRWQRRAYILIYFVHSFEKIKRLTHTTSPQTLYKGEKFL